MEKRALQLASVASMIDQFNIPNIELLQSLGYKVDVVADFTNPGTITNERSLDLQKRLAEMDVRVFDIEIPRTLNPKNIIKAYQSIKKLLVMECYQIIHCHSPIGGAICRMAALKSRKMGTKVIYTAHGFHFYKGAPIKNWIIYYPIEKILSRWTDVLITITKEDYHRAQKKFKAMKIEYVPGIGVDLEKFSNANIERDLYRKSLGLKPDDIMLLSVGELNENKNHSIVIKALGSIKEENIHYFIAGTGILKEQLINFAKDQNVSENVHLLGYRTDIPELLKSADIYILPSIREGLNVSLMEAMTSGVPCICGRIRGNVDLIEHEKGGYLFDINNDVELSNILNKISKDNVIEMGNYNRGKIKLFSKDEVLKTMRNIYIQING